MSSRKNQFRLKLISKVDEKHYLERPQQFTLCERTVELSNVRVIVTLLKEDLGNTVVVIHCFLKHSKVPVV